MGDSTKLYQNKALFVVDLFSYSFHFNFSYKVVEDGKRETWCEVETKEWTKDTEKADWQNGKVVATTWGVARCTPTDNFCRATGRKLALKRALFQLDGFLREEEIAVNLEELHERSWHNYFSATDWQPVHV